jgi:hypothetical protein
MVIESLILFIDQIKSNLVPNKEVVGVNERSQQVASALRLV